MKALLGFTKALVLSAGVFVSCETNRDFNLDKNLTIDGGPAITDNNVRHYFSTDDLQEQSRRDILKCNAKSVHGFYPFDDSFYSQPKCIRDKAYKAAVYHMQNLPGVYLYDTVEDFSGGKRGEEISYPPPFFFVLIAQISGADDMHRNRYFVFTFTQDDWWGDILLSSSPKEDQGLYRKGDILYTAKGKPAYRIHYKKDKIHGLSCILEDGDELFFSKQPMSYQYRSIYEEEGCWSKSKKDYMKKYLNE